MDAEELVSRDDGGFRYVRIHQADPTYDPCRMSRLRRKLYGLEGLSSV